MYSIIEQLFMRNADAVLALPTEIKTILGIAILIWLISGVMRSAAKIIGIALGVGVVYYILTFIGII